MLHTLISNAIFSQKKKARVGKLYTPTFTTDTASIWLCSKNVNHFSKAVNVLNVFVKFSPSFIFAKSRRIQSHFPTWKWRLHKENYKPLWKARTDANFGHLRFLNFQLLSHRFLQTVSLIFNFCKKSNNQKTARTKSRFSQQPSKLGIEVGGVLKTKNRAEQLLFYALN